jgi:deoxyribodipyrimidine photolyase-like uncharacterized protein
MGSTLFLFSHQLHPIYLEEATKLHKVTDVVLVDSDDQWTKYHYHQQRILLHLSAMHHYVDSLNKQGIKARIIQGKTLVKALSGISGLIVY